MKIATILTIAILICGFVLITGCTSADIQAPNASMPDGNQITDPAESAVLPPLLVDTTIITLADTTTPEITPEITTPPSAEVPTVEIPANVTESVTIPEANITPSP